MADLPDSQPPQPATMAARAASSEIKNAIIRKATLDIADRGLLTAWIDLDYGSTGQGFGGYALYLPRDWSNHRLASGYAGHFIFRVLQVAGVGQWDRLQGRTVRVRATSSNVEAIGHIINDDWFCPADDFREGRT